MSLSKVNLLLLFKLTKYLSYQDK